MKRWRIREWDSVKCILTLWMAFFLGVGPGSLIHAETLSPSPKPSGTRRQELSAQGNTWLGAAIASGTFPDLRWPDFSDYKGQVQKFYEAEGNSLSWVEGMEPTPQAREVICVVASSRPEGTFLRRLRWTQVERPAGQTQTLRLGSRMKRRREISISRLPFVQCGISPISIPAR